MEMYLRRQILGRQMMDDWQVVYVIARQILVIVLCTLHDYRRDPDVMMRQQQVVAMTDTN
jgi:hypothetical protein